jgi:CelD/BcsL family acetyltransferase involved in cellulose biosynthesis
MPQFTFLTSLAELREAAPAWDDLWQRSDCTSPLARADMVAHWLEHFAPSARIRVAVVEENGRWLAALPLVERKARGVLRAGALPCNEWPSGATLLWDVCRTGISQKMEVFPAEAGTTSAAMTSAVDRLPWQLVWLEAAMPARASWQALYGAVTAAGLACDLRTRWHVGRLAIGHNWPAEQARLSRKHRQRTASSLRKLADRGEVGFELHQRIAADQLEPLLERAMAVDDRSWKAAAATSIRRTPGAAEFMRRQAKCLADRDQLWLAFLRCGPRDAAFCYGVFAKGVMHSMKIGYDAEFAPYSPGHLLQYHLLQAVHADARVVAVDYIGQLTEYHASWRPESYPFARLVFAPRGKLVGQAAIWSYKFCRKLRVNSTSPMGLPTRLAISAGAKP